MINRHWPSSLPTLSTLIKPGEEQSMRLTSEEITVITDAIHQAFGQQARVWLFGSRVDDSKKGGDIDLLVEPPADCDNLLDKKLKALVAIQLKLGEQKIDLVIANNPDRLIEQEARKTGVEL